MKKRITIRTAERLIRMAHDLEIYQSKCGMRI